MKQYNVYPECYVDTNFVSHILGATVKHKSSCNEVVKAINHSDGFAVGVIDADKRLPSMDIGFKLYTSNKNQHVSLYVHEDRKRFIFTVKPAMDQFILEIAKDLGIDLHDYNFPSRLADFKKRTKRVTAANDPNLRKLFSAIESHPEIERFRNTLKYMVEKNLNIDYTLIIEFFEGEKNKQDLHEILFSKY